MYFLYTYMDWNNYLVNPYLTGLVAQNLACVSEIAQRKRPHHYFRWKLLIWSIMLIYMQITFIDMIFINNNIKLLQSWFLVIKLLKSLLGNVRLKIIHVYFIILWISYVFHCFMNFLYMCVIVFNSYVFYLWLVILMVII